MLTITSSIIVFFMHHFRSLLVILLCTQHNAAPSLLFYLSQQWSVCLSVHLSICQCLSLSPFDRLLVYQVFLNIFTFDCKKLCPVEKVTQEHWTCVWCIDLESFNIELIYCKIVRNSYVIFDPIKVYAFGKVMVL